MYILNKLVLLLSLGSSMLTGAASAATCTFGDGGASLQAVLNNITTGGSSSVNVTTDCLADSSDSLWSITGSGGASSTIVIELAGFAGSNTFGIYDPAGGEVVELFSGSASAGAQAFFSIKADGSVWVDNIDTSVDFDDDLFGFYLKSPEGTFHSDSSSNPDNQDHMYAYQGNNTDEVTLPNLNPGTWTDNEFVLAWEDLLITNGNSDGDYNDFVVMVESIEPVPVPAAAWLFGSGLLGLIGMARRKQIA